MKVKEGESTQLLSCAMHRHNLNITAVVQFSFRSTAMETHKLLKHKLNM